MAFVHPELVLGNLHLAEGMRVADFGTGSGAYALVASKMVGHTGRVYAVDVQKELLATLEKVAERTHRSNIETMWGDIDRVGGTKIAEGIIDVVIVSNVLFQSEHAGNLAKEASRILRHGGTVMVIDWSESFGNMGPTPGHVVRADEAKLFFSDAGFAFERSFSAGDHHYGLLFHKP